VRDASVRTREVRLGHWTDDTHRSLYLGEALVWVDRGEDGLDEGMMPPGDGAWRSGSALWLAVPAAALRWTEDLGLAVENEARIWGDSDSVACLTGALLGAAAIPPEWLRTLPPRGEIAGLADRLVAQSLHRCVG
jgi:ADP-ribosylglycohydrolase